MITIYGDEEEQILMIETLETMSRDLITEDMTVTLTHEGFIKRTSEKLYKNQRRGGVGRTGATSKNDDFAEHVFVASTHDYVMFFTSSGKCFWRKVHELPESSLTARGRALTNILNLSENENVISYVSL